ncbi:TRAP transporter small permease [Chitinibacteraceae bacterium HSL-7]
MTQENQAPRSLLVRAGELFLAVTLAAMVLAVFTNVVLRYGFGTGIAFYEELSRLLFVWLVCVGAVLAMADGQHIGFDMVVARLRGVPAKVCCVLARLLIGYGLVLVVQGAWQQVLAGMESFSPVMGYPLALMAAATLFMAAAMLLLLAYESMALLRKGEGA